MSSYNKRLEIFKSVTFNKNPGTKKKKMAQAEGTPVNAVTEKATAVW